MYPIALALWATFLGVAAYYTLRDRNPRMRPLAAYLMFVTAFTVASAALFVVIVVLFGALGQDQTLANPITAAIFPFGVFVPAFFVARWLIRRPPLPPGAAVTY